MAPLKPAPVSRSQENSGSVRRDLEWQFTLPQKRLNVAKDPEPELAGFSVSPALVARLSHNGHCLLKLRNAVSTTGEAGFFSNQPLFSTIEFVRDFNLFLIVL
jgi:hypothetical protein